MSVPASTLTAVFFAQVISASTCSQAYLEGSFSISRQENGMRNVLNAAPSFSVPLSSKGEVTLQLKTVGNTGVRERRAAKTCSMYNRTKASADVKPSTRAF